MIDNLIVKNAKLVTPRGIMECGVAVDGAFSEGFSG
jgi:hypothetical protein